MLVEGRTWYAEEGVGVNSGALHDACCKPGLLTALSMFKGASHVTYTTVIIEGPVEEPPEVLA
jgi:hypothetical protein